MYNVNYHRVYRAAKKGDLIEIIRPKCLSYNYEAGCIFKVVHKGYTRPHDFVYVAEFSELIHVSEYAVLEVIGGVFL